MDDVDDDEFDVDVTPLLDSDMVELVGVVKVTVFPLVTIPLSPPFFDCEDAVEI